MTKIRIEKDVKNCRGCPYCREIEHYTFGGWDGSCDYVCDQYQTKGGPRIIAEYVEADSEIPEVPDWCPCRVIKAKAKCRFATGDVVYYITLTSHNKFVVQSDVIAQIIEVNGCIYCKTLKGNTFFDEQLFHFEEFATAHALWMNANLTPKDS